MNRESEKCEKDLTIQRLSLFFGYIFDYNLPIYLVKYIKYGQAMSYFIKGLVYL